MANWRTVAVRGFGQDTTTHLANIDVDIRPFSFDTIALLEWLEMQNWPTASCGVNGRPPRALCGQRVPSDRDGVILEGPDTPIGCQGCRQAQLSYLNADS